MNKTVFRLTAISAMLVAGGGAFAQSTSPSSSSSSSSTTCEQVLSSLASLASSPSFASFYSSQLEEYKSHYPQCFPSTSAASTQQISATSFQQVSMISANIGTRLLNAANGPQRQASLGVSGLAAGGIADNWNSWGNLGQSLISYVDNPTAFNPLKSSSNINNLVVGGDYRLSSDMLVGGSLALDRSRGSISRVSASTPTSTSTDGFSLAPYFGWQIMDSLALDASFGFGKGKSDFGQSRTTANRLFYAANLSYAQWFDNWQVSGKAGYLNSRERFGDLVNNGATANNTAGTSRLGQVRLGVEAGYWMPGGVMPFFGLMYSNDVTRNTQGASPWDKTAFTLSAGLNFFSLKDKLTGGVVLSDESGRSNSRNRSLMGNIGMRF